jgi:hypothetical protein
MSKLSRRLPTKTMAHKVVYSYKTKSMYDPQPKLLSEPRDYLTNR